MGAGAMSNSDTCGDQSILLAFCHVEIGTFDLTRKQKFISIFFGESVGVRSAALGNARLTSLEMAAAGHGAAFFRNADVPPNRTQRGSRVFNRKSRNGGRSRGLR